MVADRARVQEQWTQRADAYATSPLHRGTPDLRRMVEVAAPAVTALVLDLATGGGHTARAFAPAVARVIGFDLTSRMLANARTLATAEAVDNMEFVQGDVGSLPFRSGAFDLVTSRAAPHHFPDLLRALVEAHRVLRPGGALLINDSMVPPDADAAAFINAAEVLRDPTHVRTRSFEEWRALLVAAGFRVEVAEMWRKEHGFQFWMDLAGMLPETKTDLEARFLAAPPAVREALGIIIQGARVVGFQDPKILLVARRA